MKTPAETVFQFDKPGSGIHINIVTLPDDPNKAFLVLSNADGRVDIVEKGNLRPYKSLQIEMMQCSIQLSNYLIIGSTRKLFIVDIAQDFEVLGHISLSRDIFSICPMNLHNIVCGQQGG